MDHQPTNPAEPIDEKRLRAYVALIDKLLLGARENANAILNAERELVDEGLVEVMGRYAESLRQYGNQEAAAFLEDCRQQITAFLRQTAYAGSGFSPSGEQETFLIQLLQTIVESEGDPNVVYPLLQVNLALLNSALVEPLSQWWEGVLAREEDDQKQALADALFRLGACLNEFPLGCPATNQKVAIAAYKNSLRVYSEAEQPKTWAWTYSNLCFSYNRLAKFAHNPRQQLDNSIIACSNALRVFTEEEYPESWALASINLGNAYLGLSHITANPRKLIENAIHAYRNCLRVFTESNNPEKWALINSNLGTAYRAFAPFTDNPQEQIGNATSACQNALRVYTETELPQDWARVNCILGQVYWALSPFTANPQEQIVNAINAYLNALRIDTEAEDPQGWASTNNELGNAYRDLARISADPLKARVYIETAIDSYRNALRIRTEVNQPRDWAMTNNNLGTAFTILASFLNEPQEQIENAIYAYRNALRVYTEAELSRDWAMVTHNLGNAYRSLASLKNNSRELLENAIYAYRNALRVYKEEELPQDWAETITTLGSTYSDLAPLSANPQEQNDNAIEAFRSALRVFDAESHAIYCLATARALGNLGFANQLRLVAIEGYSLAIKAAENIRASVIDPARRAEVLSQAIEVYANLVQIHVDMNDFDLALEVVDRSKARNLVELLTTKDLYPKGEIPPEVIKRLDELRGSIARAERELNWADRNSGSGGTLMGGSDGSGGPAGVRSLAAARFQQARAQDVGERLGQLKQELDRLIQEQIQPIDPTFSLSQKVQPLSIEELQATLPDDRTVLVSWYVAGSKLLAFILTRNARQPLCHRYPESTLELLTAELDSYFGTYQSDKNAWMAELPAALARISSLLELEALAEQISQFAPAADQLILVPHRFLHLLPLHCLPFGESSASLQDQFARGVRFAPSLQVLQVVQQRQQTPLESLFALQNPTQDLLYSELEVEAIQSLFTAKKPAVLKRSEASKRALEEQAGSLASSTCLHFACHGYFNFAQPLLSALILAGSRINLAPEESEANRHWPQPDGTAIDLNQCLTLLDLFQLDLRQSHLVALSACETGLSELNSLSDEFVGLSSGFLYAGCNSVIGTLWTVNDLSTGLLMGEFYRLLKQQEQTQQHTEVALALKQAQRWLRRLTCAEAVTTLQQQVPNLPEELQQTALLNIRRSLSERYEAEDCPYSNPFYWAAFCAVGQ